MTERAARPPARLTHNVYEQLFHSGHSLSKLRDAVTQGRLLQSSNGTIGGAHAQYYQLFLLKDEPLQHPPDEIPTVPIEFLRKSRKQFSILLLEKMRAPDGSYDESFVVPGLAIPRRTEQSVINLETNNPLSLHDENPWKEWFSAVDLRKTIQQDVERTFPDMGYFRNEDVQHQLTNVLFLYSVMHPDIGYRQGMHELLAPLFYAIDFDSVSESTETSEIDVLFAETCSRSWVAADAWTLFSALMRGISQWYEWREPTPPPSSRGPVNLKPYVPPIVQACNHIQGTLLKSVDPPLYDAMQTAGIEPQIYGLRWLRLLFTREFPMDEAMMLWDGLFTRPSAMPELVQWICIAMLIRIRTKMIPSDYSTQLTHLLRYPPCPTPEEGAPRHILLLIRQAIALEMSHTPSTGATLMIENRNLLNIPLEVPETVPPRRRVRLTERSHQGNSSEGHPSTEHLRQQPSFHLGFPELIARGLLDRGESLGINKTVMNAVSEIKRNLPDLASNLVRTPSFGTPSSFAAYPLLDEKTAEERSTGNRRGLLESARELTELRQQNKHLGEALTWILGNIDQKEDDQENPEGRRMQRTRALESLSYVRDVLSGQVAEVDERRLWGEEEFKRRWETREKPLSWTAEPSTSRRDARPSRASGTLSSSSPRDDRRVPLHTSVASSSAGPLRSFVSPVPPTRAASLASGTSHNHGRSHSAGGGLSSRSSSQQRLPMRISANNPFQRVSDVGSESRPVGDTAAGDQPSNQTSGETQHDPLGVLR
ncbi:rab-GTPase-TBC domain-containing protein [Phlebopus sp. FC_14]|nr:rab-GTPase-TBC domain-containing protein [Phlebopus sp. FC_14]